ncbi:type II secretion system inner membrane protein GspF [Pseudemcibacter aquimaris]|uniref:type II secretion system inner membrane protein GspF n=1 Tax=Pseudemcibacter aquimaris TaxID=2857064 RepID=UPI0020117E28|nr:type II secretion system inner membrane protein GspF [Pseudemcibacter aquimaris]MCC3861760.1 type II secretion system inner membrane protein GspF [Pseudemcibacter aquimaris]WDU58526.1 type II secretion system inner membrane protein GspF [Pseudemcibacter aquimaris]
MPAYNYEALDRSGKAKRGVIAADSLREAREKLRSKSLYPVNVILGKDKVGFSIGGFNLKPSKSIKPKDLTMVTRQLATMLSAGTPVEEALVALSAQSDSAVVKETMTRLRVQVSEGKKLSEAMASEKNSFPALYRAMVRAGEASGDLGNIMERIADYNEKSEEMKNKVSTAMVYPAVLSVVALSVLVILMTFVVPKVVSQFENIGAELPALTKGVIAFSDFLLNYGGFLIILVVGGIFSYFYAMKNPALKLSVHGALLKTPVLGKLILSVSSARFARTMGTLIDGGSPVPDSIKAAKEIVRNEVIRNAIDKVYTGVMEGQALSVSLKRVSIFPPLLVYMCSMGERSGKLPFLLLKIADYLEREFDSFTQKAMSLLEPAIVVIMGLMVGLIVLSIMLPIMRLNNLVLM